MAWLICPHFSKALAEHWGSSNTFFIIIASWHEGIDNPNQTTRERLWGALFYNKSLTAAGTGVREAIQSQGHGANIVQKREPFSLALNVLSLSPLSLSILILYYRTIMWGTCSAWVCKVVCVCADSRFAPSQWETSLQKNTASHWLGANLESRFAPSQWETSLQSNAASHWLGANLGVHEGVLTYWQPVYVACHCLCCVLETWGPPNSESLSTPLHSLAATGGEALQVSKYYGARPNPTEQRHRTRRGLNKIADILQQTFLGAFCWMKSFIFCFKISLKFVT